MKNYLKLILVVVVGMGLLVFPTFITRAQDPGETSILPEGETIPEELTQENMQENDLLVLEESKLPPHAPGEVLVGLREGAMIDEVLEEVGITPLSVERILDIRIAIDKYRDANNGAGTSNTTSASDAGVSVSESSSTDEEIFENEIYPLMDPLEKRLFRGYKIGLPEDISIEAAIIKLSTCPSVDYAEPNYLLSASFVPNDPEYINQWSHKKTNAEAGWDITRGDPGVVIAIIDTGVDYKHLDLKDNIWHDLEGNPGKDFVNINVKAYQFWGWKLASDNREDYQFIDYDPSDYNGHGTHCAGIAGAVSNNGIGVAGVAHNCKIMPVRALFHVEKFPWYLPQVVDAFGEVDDITNAIYYATAKGADVISMSLGLPLPSDIEKWVSFFFPVVPLYEWCVSPAKDAVDYAHSQGVILVAAAGNNDDNGRHFPASDNNVIAVAATDENDNLADFSNYGTWVDLAAPGVNILSTLPSPISYGSMDGTSMATPYVAGVAGLLLSEYPLLNNEEVRQRLKYGCDIPGVDFPEWNNKYIAGGRINIYKALNIDNMPTAIISSPAQNQYIQKGNTIDIIGTSSGDSYKVWYAKENNPYSWHLAGKGTQEVTDDKLGVLDTSNLEAGSKYMIRLVVYKGLDAVADSISFHLIKRQHPGWPKDLNESIVAGPIPVDLNGDGHKEIIVATEDEYSTFVKVHVLDENASVDGWPNIVTEYGYIPLIAAGNIDSDPEFEIVFSSGKKLYAWDNNGVPLTSWPKSVDLITDILLADINNDDRLEIITTDKFGSVIVYDYGAKELWSISAGSHAICAAVGDVDNDSNKEVVVASSYTDQNVTKRKISVLNGMTGVEKISWVVENDLFDIGITFLALGDIDHSGTLTIVGGNKDKICAWRSDGTTFGDWPANSFSISRSNFSTLLSDLDGNGKVETLETIYPWFRFSQNRIAVYDYKGKEVQYAPENFSSDDLFLPALITADLNNNGDQEIIGRSENEIFIFNNDGTPYSSWPIPPGNNPSQVYYGLSIDDVDNDGKLEVFAVSAPGLISMWDLETEYGFSSWPMPKHDPQRTGCYVPVNNPPYIGEIHFPNLIVAEEPTIFWTKYYDNDGFEDIHLTAILVNDASSKPTDIENCLFAIYNQNSSMLHLRNDKGAKPTWKSAKLGSHEILYNSYVKLDCFKTEVFSDRTGGDVIPGLNVLWYVTFKPTFLGEKKIYLYVSDDTGLYDKDWQTLRGTCTIIKK